MKYALILITFLSGTSSLFAQLSSAELQQPWRQAYAGNDATDQQVIALWSFDDDNPGADQSGNGHSGKLMGAKINPGGRFGSGLESFVGFPVIDERHALVVPNSPLLTPVSAFTVEMWINPGEKMNGYSGAVLMDKKYVTYGHTDYIFSIGGRKDDTLRPLTMQLGFGQRSVNWHSDRVPFETGQWMHIAFTYDGEGTGEFFVNGQLSGSRTEAGVGNVVPGERSLSIGDRNGSNYRGFPGLIDQVRISKGVLEFRPVRIQRISDRSVFRRMEQDVPSKFRVTNLQRKPMPEARLVILTDGQGAEPIRIPTLKPGASTEIAFEFDTAMRPGKYQVSATLSIGSGDTAYETVEPFEIQIVPRPLPDQFPVLMWGSGKDEIDRLRNIGFTHALGIGIDNGSISRG